MFIICKSWYVPLVIPLAANQDCSRLWSSFRKRQAIYGYASKNSDGLTFAEGDGHTSDFKLVWRGMVESGTGRCCIHSACRISASGSCWGLVNFPFIYIPDFFPFTSTGASCFLMGPRWLIYPILSYPIHVLMMKVCHFSVLFFTCLLGILFNGRENRKQRNWIHLQTRKGSYGKVWLNLNAVIAPMMIFWYTIICQTTNTFFLLWMHWICDNPEFNQSGVPNVHHCRLRSHH